MVALLMAIPVVTVALLFAAMVACARDDERNGRRVVDPTWPASRDALDRAARSVDVG
jgi:hypothetical protein